MTSGTTTVEPRQRLLDAAYDLFSRRGIRDVGIDELIEAAGIAKATLYRHFTSKDDLVEGFLQERERRWTFGFVAAGAREAADTPEGQLLAIFDVFDRWFNDADFDACAFINTLVEMRPGHRLGRASITHLRHIRDMAEGLATEAHLDDPKGFAHSWHILMKGSIIAATEGDTLAAQRARLMAEDLVARHRHAA
jgi:AcrR family transcriptional regulator